MTVKNRDIWQFQQGAVRTVLRAAVGAQGKPRGSIDGPGLRKHGCTSLCTAPVCAPWPGGEGLLLLHRLALLFQLSVVVRGGLPLGLEGFLLALH